MVQTQTCLCMCAGEREREKERDTEAENNQLLTNSTGIQQAPETFLQAKANQEAFPYQSNLCKYRKPPPATHIQIQNTSPLNFYHSILRH